MDRANVEVVAAVRPRGHVLQVTQGKGRTAAEAQWSAVGEAAELFAAETVDDAALTWSKGSALEGFVLDDDGLERAWVRGARLADAAPVWLAAERVYCPPQGSRWLGPSTSTWTSNGLGAHATRLRAIEHAVLEVWERHALTLALPSGWTLEALERTRVDHASALVEQLTAAGFVVVTALLTRSPFPVAGALLFDVRDEAVPLTAGYACRRDADGALEASVLEAAQSRVTEIHGAREDVAIGQRTPSSGLLESLPPPRRLERRSTVRGWPRAVAGRVVVVELRREPLVVVKAIGVDLEESELLR